jgi:ubiquinone/menaquinone biosynthesis C-methylase UbiE
VSEHYTHGHHETLLATYSRRTAGEAAAFLLPHLSRGMRIVDIGCGPGSITAGLAAAVTPGAVIGIDESKESIARARKEHGGLGNLSFIVASAYRLPVDDAGVDVAYAHQVLQHLGEPATALVEMGRALRPGGLVAVRDADYGTMIHWPHESMIDRWLELYHATQRRHGGEPDAGRRLLAWVDEAGFVDPTVTTTSWVFADAGARTAWSEMWVDRLLPDQPFAELAAELTSRNELDEIIAGWRRWAQQPNGVFAFLNVEVLAHRP